MATPMLHDGGGMDSVLRAVDVSSLVQRARSDGWTISYESNLGNWMGIARRGSVRLEALSDTIVDAIWRVLQKTHLPHVGGAVAAQRVLALVRAADDNTPPCYGQCGGCERGDCPN